MANLVVVLFWLTISETLSISWSSSINSLFARNSKFGDIGMNKALIESVGYGAQMALEYCQENFKWDRWNCPESAFSRRSSSHLTRETSFTLALKSAGVIHSITRNCSRGELSNCGCDSSYSGGGYTEHGVVNNTSPSQQEPAHWTWGGCSESTQYAEQVMERVVDDSKKDWMARLRRHNYNAGKMVIRATMKKHCRCHGVSGSCSLQTCWMQMASFQEITAELRNKYEKAQKIDDIQKFNSIENLNSDLEVAPEELVYLNESPNYCRIDISTGWNGTKGRACSRNKSEGTSPSERKSCKNLCRSCGHRVRKERRRLTRRCNCTFNWCCDVQCETCQDIVEEYFCE